MLDLAELVDRSLARYGIEAPFDPSRVQWSAWVAVEDHLALLQVPGKAGLYALAEELSAPAAEGIANKRVLALFEISEAEDLGLTLGRRFLSPGPRLVGKKYFTRYAVIEDDRQRLSAYLAFRRWVATQKEAGSGLARSGPNQFTSDASPASGLSHGSSNKETQNGPPEAFLTGS
ncbi:MAG TPA: hypothetical protein VF753_21255 [Terriglobales bacterium]